MTLNFQNKIVFPAPESSYTTESSFGQVIYIPRNILKREPIANPPTQTQQIIDKNQNDKALFSQSDAPHQPNKSQITLSVQDETINSVDASLIQQNLNSNLSAGGITTARQKLQKQESSKGDVNHQEIDKINTDYQNEDQQDRFEEDLQKIEQEFDQLNGNQEYEDMQVDIVQPEQVNEENNKNSINLDIEERRTNQLSLHKSMSTKLVSMPLDLNQNAQNQDEKNSQSIQQMDLVYMHEQKQYSSSSVENLQSDSSKITLKSSIQTKSFFSFLSSSNKPKPVEKEEYIPCLYIPNENGGNKLVLYFHGNAEDIGYAFEIMYSFGAYSKMHILCIEYPGYGLYRSSPPNDQYIRDDALVIYDYLTQSVGLKPQDIMLFGRSLGSGPATYLASQREVFCLYLMSAYTSIKDVSKTLLGKLSFFLTPLVLERFRNVDNIKNVKCPVFFLHGLKDTLIPYTHAQELKRNCQTMSQLWLPDDMDHNSFDFLEDLVIPFLHFKDVIDTSQEQIYLLQEELQKQQEELEQSNNNQQQTQSKSTFSSSVEESKGDKVNIKITSKQNTSIIRKVLDSSHVTYNLEAKTFEIFFDGPLYTPPQLIIDLEKDAHRKQQEKLKAQNKK